MRYHLTIQEQSMLAKALRSSSQLVYSFDLAPVDVNILPMQIVADTKTIDHCVEALRSRIAFSPTYAREIVLSVLASATDTGRGHKENDNTSAGGATPGTSSGSGND